MPNLVETIELIQNFNKLPVGWNFGEGVPTSTIVLGNSSYFLTFAYNLGIVEFEVFPGVSGEIQLCCYLEDNTLEMTFEVDGNTTIVFEKRGESAFYKPNASFAKTIEILKDFRFNQCRLYESSISNSITASDTTASQVWRLDPRLLTAGFPSSRKNVPRKRVLRSVRTSKDTTQMWQGLRLSSGKSLAA